MDHVFRFKYREDGNLISAFLYLKEKPRYFCSVLYFGRYIFLFEIFSCRDVGRRYQLFYRICTFIKYEKNKPEYFGKSKLYIRFNDCFY